MTNQPFHRKKNNIHCLHFSNVIKVLWRVRKAMFLFSFLRGKYKHQKELLFLSGGWQLWILIWTKTCENAHYSKSFPVYWKTCLSEIDGKAEGLFSRQPETQLIQWWQVLWKGFHHFQHNNSIHSNIIKQTKRYWNPNLFILSSCHTSTVFISGSRGMIFSHFKTT